MMGGGNPLKKISKEVSRVAESAVGAATDPGTLLTGSLGGGMGLTATVGQKTAENYELIKDEEQAKRDAAAQAKAAKLAEEKARKEQEKMISDKAKEEARIAKDRAARLGQGRRGLLYQGTGEMGVPGKSKTLGG